jgi:hypothetical protein
MTIRNIAWRAGGVRVLAAAGDETGKGPELLRDAIAAHAANGNAAVVNSTIDTLFPISDSPLTNDQLLYLADELVNCWKP